MFLSWLFGKKEKVEQVNVIETVDYNWRNILKPGDYISKEAYEFIRGVSKLHARINLLTNKMTPEYFQVEESVPIMVVMRDNDKLVSSPVYHTFDWDISKQEYYIYHGLCLSGSVVDRSASVQNVLN